MLGHAKKFTRTMFARSVSEPDDVSDIKGLLRVRKYIIRVIALAAFVVLLFHQSAWPAGSMISDSLVRVGVVLIACGIVGRTWAWAHLGRRRYSHFVADGPYSVVRHPLYTFSIVGAAGIGLQSGSFIVGVVVPLLVWVVLRRMAQLEESAMAARFGEPYRDYLARTPRLAPNLSLWNTPEGVWVDYQQTIKGFRHASLFVLAVPIFIGIDWAQRAGFLPILLRLP
jgi:protein-S-isoprenylcysteine O-methyltransferase Ste14